MKRTLFLLGINILNINGKTTNQHKKTTTKVVEKTIETKVTPVQQKNNSFAFRFGDAQMDHNKIYQEFSNCFTKSQHSKENMIQDKMMEIALQLTLKGMAPATEAQVKQIKEKLEEDIKKSWQASQAERNKNTESQNKELFAQVSSREEYIQVLFIIYLFSKRIVKQDAVLEKKVKNYLNNINELNDKILYDTMLETMQMGDQTNTPADGKTQEERKQNIKKYIDTVEKIMEDMIEELSPDVEKAIENHYSNGEFYIKLQDGRKISAQEAFQTVKNSKNLINPIKSAILVLSSI